MLEVLSFCDLRYKGNSANFSSENGFSGQQLMRYDVINIQLAWNWKFRVEKNFLGSVLELFTELDKLLRWFFFYQIFFP